MNEAVPRSEARKTGFILVAVLLLIALVTVLVVATSFLAQIERRAVGNAARIETARQNALFGLGAALGQLQKSVGPDQAVTARADILDTNLSATATSGVTGVLDPYWTGAWKTYNPNAASQNLDVDVTGTASANLLRSWSTAPVGGRPGASNLNMDWLVSGAALDHANAGANATALKIIPTTWTPVLAAGGATPRNAVVLARNLPDLSKAPTTMAVVNVAAPLVAIRSSTAPRASDPVLGQYAYWVSDEGVKAKANLRDPTLEANGNLSYAKNQTHFLAPQANGMANVLPTTTGQDVRMDPAVPKISTLQSLALLPSIDGTKFQASGAAHFSPDVTTYGFGVLADVRNGGLKRDLTAAFEDDKTVNASGQFQALVNSNGTGLDGIMVYRSTNPALAVPVITAGPAGGTGPTMDGLRWESLYHYYNLYKSVLPLWRSPGNNAPVPTGVPATNLGFVTGPYSIQQSMHTYNDGIGGGNLPMDPIAPVVLLARVDIGLCSFLDPNTGNYRLRLRYYPTLVLYNPFGVRITATQATSYNFYTDYFNINGRWNCIFKVNGASIPPFESTKASPTGYSLVQGSGYPLDLAAKSADVVSFDPGEIKVFTLTTDVAKASLGDTPKPPFSSATNVCIIQSLTSSSVNMSADYAQTYDLTWLGTANPLDKVTVDVASKNLTANAAYVSGSPLNAWPDSSVNGASNQRFQSLNLPSVTPAGTWPAGGIAISSLTGSGYLLVGSNVRSKGTQKTTDTNYLNYNYAPPPFVGNRIGFSDADGGDWREVYARALKPYASVSEVQMDNPPDGQPHHTSWGQHSVGDGPVSDSNSRIPTRDVPCQPMISLGQFSHLAAWYYFTSGPYGHLYLPGRSIGGSFPSDVPLNNNTGATGGNLGGNPLAFDGSFMANQVLFDSYYFSTVPAAAQPGADTAKYPMKSSELDAAVQNNLPLPDNRMRFYYKNSTIPTVGSLPTLGTYKADLRDVKQAATRLMVDGAFNVNSTSVNAWKALLSSLSGNGLKVWNYTTRGSFSYTSANLVNPIPRFWNLTWVGGVNQAWEGMRTLTPDDASGKAGGLTALATHIVQQVKTRGPFLSMGDFLNRRLGSGGTLCSMGALQEAIEECTVPNDGNNNINAAAIAAGTTVALPTGSIGAPANSATGIPGYLMQQDLVQAFAPAMSARSDTFVVRCYGETNNPKALAADGSPQTEARAWGEAVVQRLPEYVDQSDPALTGTNAYGTNLGDATPVFDRITNPNSPTAIVNAINKTFGRRLKIVAFRWLNESDL